MALGGAGWEVLANGLPRLPRSPQLPVGLGAPSPAAGLLAPEPPCLPASVRSRPRALVYHESQKKLPMLEIAIWAKI